MAELKVNAFSPEARKALLICGILSSLLYVGADILAAMQWEGYS